MYYFTSNNLVGSKIIRWGLDDDCSHFAIGFYDHEWSLIVESTLGGGFNLCWKSDFLKRNKMVHILRHTRDKRWEGEQYRNICGRLHGSSYDYKGIAFWTAIALAYKSGIIEKDEMDGFNNRWADRNSVYCAEVLKAQSEFLGSIGFNMDDLKRQNLRPHKAYRLLLATGAFEDLPVDGQVF